MILPALQVWRVFGYKLFGWAENFDMSRPAVSKHIKIMYNAGFISIKDIGRERYCTLKQDGFNELQNFINYFDKFWKAIFLELKTDNVEEMKQKIVAFGVRVLDVPDSYLYFQASGGQVFRLVGINEDLSKYESDWIKNDRKSPAANK